MAASILAPSATYGSIDTTEHVQERICGMWKLEKLIFSIKTTASSSNCWE